jgi:putative ABC transport system permease protein
VRLPLATLLHLGRRYLQRHALQSALMVLGVALGVAVAVAVDIANAGARRAFNLSAEAVVGRATHQIVGGPAGLDESLYTRLRTEGGLRLAAPAIAEYVSSPQLGNRPFQLIGIDPFAETPFRSYLALGDQSDAVDWVAFLTQPGAILISRDIATQYGIEPGAMVQLDVAGRGRSATVVGLLDAGDSAARRSLDGVILADVATAQELTGRLGLLDRIDVILPEGEMALSERAARLLPAGVRLAPVEARTGPIEEMTAAFSANLTALSLLALLVGMFLIYNAMTFSVVLRRPLFGTLRCLGATRSEIFGMILAEAALVGVAGTGLGLLLGVVLGQGALRMVTQTVNDLYFVVTVRSVGIPSASLLKGAALGLVATVLTSAPPAWEAASATPRVALSRSLLETKAQQTIMRAAAGALAIGILGAAILAIPTRSLEVSFAGTFAVVMGFAMLTPVTALTLMRGAMPALGRIWGILGRMAPRNVISALSRTSVAVAALMVAVSVTIGVDVMVGSFRYTVGVWLEQSFQGDIYVSVPGVADRQATAAIEPAAVDLVRRWPGVERVDLLRMGVADSPRGAVGIAAFENPDYGLERLFASADRPATEIWDAMLAGAVLVSEPLATRWGLPAHGGSVALLTNQGQKTFPVAGIFHDYSSSQGYVSIAMDVYRRYWNDSTVTALSLRLAPGIVPETMVRELQDALSEIQSVSISDNRGLRRDVLTIFDRTFAITNALRLLATLVAFLGVLSALLSVQLEKTRELGILRAIGLTARQLWRLTLLETGLLGASAGLLAMPTGVALSLILIYIINRRSFGWTLQVAMAPGTFVMAFLVAVAAALLAGVYPAYRLGRMATAEAMHGE